MICAACDEQTDQSPCHACDEDPLLAGAYRLEDMLGTGAAATTWRATRIADRRTVAVKEMVVSRARADKSTQLFEREARVLRQLDHPQIPAYLDDFCVGTGKVRSLCLVQEHVEGVTLAAELATHRYTEGEVLDICAELADVLGYLHGLSPPVIHRDLKPRNVIRRSDGVLVLIDFGAVLEEGPRVKTKDRRATENDPFHQPPMRAEPPKEQSALEEGVPFIIMGFFGVVLSILVAMVAGSPRLAVGARRGLAALPHKRPVHSEVTSVSSPSSGSSSPPPRRRNAAPPIPKRTTKPPPPTAPIMARLARGLGFSGALLIIGISDIFIGSRGGGASLSANRAKSISPRAARS